MKLYEKNSTVPVSNLIVGQTITVEITVEDLEPNYDLQINDCHVKGGNKSVQIIDNGRPVPLFIGLVGIRRSSVKSISTFDLRIFQVGNSPERMYKPFTNSNLYFSQSSLHCNICLMFSAS